MNELCGIEFRNRKDLNDFRSRNPVMTTLRAGQHFIVLFECADFPTRNIQEMFDQNGKHRATFIGPDALEYTYQIKLGKPGGYSTRGIPVKKF